MIQFNKDKYLGILKSQGLSAALTALHQDTYGWEHETFEGRKGWQPKMWEELKEVREFSLELWDMRYENERK